MKSSCPVARLATVWRHVLPACMLLTVFGCALGDYESRIDAQRKRLEYLDEEARYLLDQIDNPRADNKEKSPLWPFEVFIRLPREYGEAVRAVYTFNGQPLFRYGGRDNFHVFVAAGLIPEKKDGKSKDKEKEKEKEKEKKENKAPAEWPVEVFRSNVRGALVDYFTKQYKADPGFKSLEGITLHKMSMERQTEYGERISALEYEAVAYQTGPLRFDLYFHQRGNRQAAIVYEYPLASANDEQLKKGIDRSLKSLLFAADATSQRIALQTRKNFKL